MKPHPMFLRTECVLPDGLDLGQKPFCKTWMSIEDTTSAVLDKRVRNAGWHFMWLAGTCRSSGIGTTEASAIANATTRALNQIQNRFNAAEVDSMKVSKYPGFQVARITLQARHIQQQASLGLIDEIAIRQLPA